MSRRRFLAVAAVHFLFVATGTAEQAWFSQVFYAAPTEKTRVWLSNSTYTEHGEHFANEEATSFRIRFADKWSAGGGITFGQDRIVRESADGDVRHHWDFSGRPTEHVSIDWADKAGGWSFSDAHRFDLYFRKGERDWPLYRNIGSVMAPPLPGLPWSPRPYLAEQIYITARERYRGLKRFCQFRWTAGVRLAPTDRLAVSTWWQYREIESPGGEWNSFRVAGLSVAYTF